jgi:spore germination protein YaaH
MAEFRILIYESWPPLPSREYRWEVHRTPQGGVVRGYGGSVNDAERDARYAIEAIVQNENRKPVKTVDVSAAS